MVNPDNTHRQDKDPRDLSGHCEIDRQVMRAWQLRASDRAAAMACALQADALCAQASLPEQDKARSQGAAWAIRAYLHLDAGQLADAGSWATRALTRLQGTPATDAHVKAHLVLAWVHIYVCECDAAFEAATRALDLAQAIGDVELQSRALDTIGSTYTDTGRYELEARAYDDALALCHQHGLVDHGAAVMLNYSDAMEDAGHHGAARDMAERALALVREHGLGVRRHVISLMRLAQLCRNAGEGALALSHLHEGLQLLGPQPSLTLKAELLWYIGTTHARGGNRAQAQAALEEALAVAQEAGYLVTQRDCHQALSELLEAMGDAPGALAQYKQFHAVVDKVRSEASAQRVAVVTVLHQLRSAQQEAELQGLRAAALQRQMDERRAVERELEQLAQLDPLTGLSNRRHFGALAMRELELASRLGHPCALAVIDIDKFKQVNDRFGHAVGDEVLVATSAALRAGIRTVDIVGRHGGEEFVLLLPGTDLGQALQLVERIRREFEGRMFQTGAGPLNITLSIGVSVLEPGTSGPTEESLTALLEHADQAMYTAKRRGRNRVCSGPPAAAGPT